MNNYFYHGIECYYGALGSAVELMLKILNTGIIFRSKATNNNNDNLDHVCLYKKNEKFDYENADIFNLSARAGWIDHCFVFIINPDLDAIKTSEDETNLVDEWRCYHDISPADIVGIALPFEAIKEYIEEDYEEEREDIKLLQESLTQLTLLVEQLNIPIYNSDVENFTDTLDAKVSSRKM